MKTNITAQLLPFLLVLFLLNSCSEEQIKRLEVTPTAYGSVDNVYLVCHEYYWQGIVGDSFRVNFEALYPITPQPEPILDVRHVDTKKFNQVMKTHRAIILLVNLEEKDDPVTKLVIKALGEKNVKRAQEDDRYRIAVHRERWAKEQNVIYWFAPNKQKLFETVVRDHKQVLNILHEADAKLLSKQVYKYGNNNKINQILIDSFGLEMLIPKGYSIAHQDSTAFWLRMDGDKVNSNIFVHTIDIADAKMLSPDSLKAIRNRVTQQYFSSWAEGSYMQIDDKNLPIFFQEVEFGESKGLQARGVWYMEKDFMGGPFVSYLIPDRFRRRLILVDGFVYAPGQKKRPEMRKLDMIFSTFKLVIPKPEG